jgi:hypothetical protein
MPANNNCWWSSNVPCQNAACVNWQTQFGTPPPACPLGGGNGTFFDCSVNEQAWQSCGISQNLPAATNCTLAIKTCGVYAFYTAKGCQGTFCGSKNMGYCYGTDQNQFP